MNNTIYIGKENPNIEKAILKLAECIDALENVPENVKNGPRFTSRRQLIKDILDESDQE